MHNMYMTVDAPHAMIVRGCGSGCRLVPGWAVRLPKALTIGCVTLLIVARGPPPSGVFKNTGVSCTPSPSAHGEHQGRMDSAGRCVVLGSSTHTLTLGSVGKEQGCVRVVASSQGARGRGVLRGCSLG